MKDVIIKFIYSNAAKGIFQIILAVAMFASAKFFVEEDWVKAVIYGGGVGLFGAGIGNLGVVAVRANTTTPPAAPDSKGDKEIKT